MENALHWFEIPVNDLDRAERFYSTILNIEFQKLDLPNIQMRIFPATGVGGALVKAKGEFYRTSEHYGPLLYLNGGNDINVPLSKVEEAGGKILIPKTKISDTHGSMAVILDSEGNRIALHNNPE